MKKICLLSVVFLSFFIFSIHAERLNSNELGQKITKESIFKLEETEGKSEIYKDGVLYSTITEVYNSLTDTFTKTTINYETEVVENKTYKDSLPVEFVTKYPDNTEEKTVFIYIDSELSCVTFVNREGKTEIEYYYRNSYDNSLMAVSRYSETELIGPDYLLSLGETINTNKGVLSSGKLDVSKEGDFSFVRNGITYYYNRYSQLIKEEDAEKVSEYIYNGYTLVKKTTVTKKVPIETTETEYENSRAVKETLISHGEILEITEFPVNSGKIKTVYSDGLPFAKVYYMNDNKRVYKVEYL